MGPEKLIFILRSILITDQQGWEHTAWEYTHSTHKVVFIEHLKLPVAFLSLILKPRAEEPLKDVFVVTLRKSSS